MRGSRKTSCNGLAKKDGNISQDNWTTTTARKQLFELQNNLNTFYMSTIWSQFVLNKNHHFSPFVKPSVIVSLPNQPSNNNNSNDIVVVFVNFLLQL